MRLIIGIYFASVFISTTITTITCATLPSNLVLIDLSWPYNRNTFTFADQPTYNMTVLMEGELLSNLGQEKVW